MNKTNKSSAQRTFELTIAVNKASDKLNAAITATRVEMFSKLSQERARRSRNLMFDIQRALNA